MKITVNKKKTKAETKEPAIRCHYLPANKEAFMYGEWGSLRLIDGKFAVVDWDGGGLSSGGLLVADLVFGTIIQLTLF